MAESERSKKTTYEAKAENREDSYHWLMWHLTAMDYAKSKLEAKLMDIIPAAKPMSSDPRELRLRLAKLRELVTWYVSIVESHRSKALSHIPECKRSAWEKEMRGKENRSYEALFCKDDQSSSREDSGPGFVTADRLKRS
jgi:hypothetical protein